MLVGTIKRDKLEDLSKTDYKFFQSMKKHKQHRLKIRRQGIEDPS